MGSLCGGIDRFHRTVVIMTLRDIRNIALALALAAYPAAGIAAQEYVAGPVTISKEKVKIDGKICYSHVVEEKQTLYSISKAYEVSVEDIYRYNPTLRETGLKKNSIIIIPSKSAIAENAARKPQNEDNTAVAKREEQVTAKQVAAEEPAVRTHTVKWYEDIESIAQKYGVTAEEIMLANGLSGKKLKNRQSIIIPEKGKYAKKPETPADISVDEEEDTNLETAFEDPSSTDFGAMIPMPKTRIKATVLLPLKATGNSSSRSNMDFYSGVMLAAKDMAEKGIDIELDVHDISSGNFGVNRFTLSQSDLTIGPVSISDLTKLFAMAPETGKIISPLDPKAGQLVTGNENMVQAPSSILLQYSDMAAWISEDLRHEDKVIVISEKEARQNDAGRMIMSAIESSSIAYLPFSYSILDGRTVQEPLERLMTQEGINRIVIASESEAFVNDVVRNLNLIVHDKYAVVLYGPAKIRSFETIEVENFHNTSLHASLAYFIDYDDMRVRNFLLRYRALFCTEPTQFAFQGYDVARYFFEMCAKYGDNWPHMLENSRQDMLQSTFCYKKTPGGGYANEGVRRIVYGTDYSVIKVK